MSKRMSRIAAVFAALAATAVLSPSPAAAATLIAPERVRVTNVTATDVSFAWSQNDSGATGILRARVYQNGALTATTRLVRYTASGLVPGATYTFHIIAADDGGNTSPPSRTLTVTTRGPGVVPPGPSNLRATGVSATRADLSFDQPDDSWDIDRYDLLDGTSVIASFPAVLSESIPTLTVPLRGLAPQSSHAYVVRAVRQSFGNSPPSNTVALTTPPRTDLSPPSVPGGLVAKKASYACFAVTLTWTPSADDTDPPSAIDYEILLNGAHENWVRGATTYQIGLVPVGTSTIAVRAVDGSGNASGDATATFVRLPRCVED